MINSILTVLKVVVALLPFLLFVLLNGKTNLKREVRCCQFLMPAISLVFCLIVVILLDPINDLLMRLIDLIPNLLTQLSSWVSGLFNGGLSGLGNGIESVAHWLENLNWNFWIYVILNTVFMLVYIVVKRILTAIFGKAFKNDGKFKCFCIKLFYEQDDSGMWCVRPQLCQGRTLLLTFYVAVIVIAMLMTIAARIFFENGLLIHSFFPAFGICVIGELYFFLNGLSAEEKEAILSGETDQSYNVVNYSLLRQALQKLFGDKLESEDTKTNLSGLFTTDNEALLNELECSNNRVEEAYSIYLRSEAKNGLDIDQSYMLSGLEMLRGKSVLFNNPFYYDLIPYIFYPMNRALLCGKKVLILLGRNSIESDIEQWCETGLTAVHHLSTLWNIDVLTTEDVQSPDVGILTRSDVHNIELHEKNKEFFEDVGFVVIVEPSRLLPTAQIGLNSIVRRIRSDRRNDIVYCSMDKNCDGLVDALSHLLMTNITEVTATQRAQGMSSYMCWLGDGDHMQHRLMLNIARYLGFGTELSFAALKNQVSRTFWYGGEAFPVRDMHWIAKQYYHDLLDYAGLPATQESFDSHFITSSNLWLARQEKYSFLTVEDEACNMFEAKRNFSTRATEQGFVNVISPEYLLKDYMAANETIFDADPKAVPYIVADYARTPRNVCLRLIVLMSAGKVWESDIEQELMLVGLQGEDIRVLLWNQICLCFTSVNLEEKGNFKKGMDGSRILTVDGRDFDASVLRVSSCYRYEIGKSENQYYIDDAAFIKKCINPLQNAKYLAEDERAGRHLLGQELRGHVFQKILPGQYFVFDGKYYEMMSETADQNVMVRRAADHIRGRISYRQVRIYNFTGLKEAPVMGADRETCGFSVINQVADLRVDTTAYWELEQYNNFKDGRLVEFKGENGIPERKYLNKNVLCLKLPEGTPADIRNTLTLLMNEVFRTLFAENSDFIVAATLGEEHPEQMTYTIQGSEGVNLREDCIYIIEDSQMDIGLLVAVERNLGRIFRIICDYLDWHLEEVEKSKNPPPPPEPSDLLIKLRIKEEAEAEKPEEPAKKPNIFRRIIDRIKKLLHIGGKDKKENPGEETEPQEPEISEGQPETDSTPEMETVEQGEAADEPETPDSDAVPDSDKSEESSDSGETEGRMESRSVSYDSNKNMILHDEADPTEDETIISEGEPGEDAEANPDDTIKVEPDSAEQTVVDNSPCRKPYHERYYLLYGNEAEEDKTSDDNETEEYKTADEIDEEEEGKEENSIDEVRGVPQGINIDGTRDFLSKLGYGNSFLTKARKGIEEAKAIEDGFEPNKKGVHYCDFCGKELLGTEYEVLKDGRERCKECSASAVKTEEEFKSLYQDVRKNMRVYFGVNITVPITIQMVNAKRLHKALGQSFVPTDNQDGRTLGVAIRSGKGEYSILLENGSPRLNAISTLAHELTHIWQYLNWDDKKIIETYGKNMRLEVYEGMAKWAEIQYRILIGEKSAAKREEIMTEQRDDEYGRGFIRYLIQYPLSYNQELGDTPFHDGLPLDPPETGETQ